MSVGVGSHMEMYKERERQIRFLTDISRSRQSDPSSASS